MQTESDSVAIPNRNGVAIEASSDRNHCVELVVHLGTGFELQPGVPGFLSAARHEPCQKLFTCGTSVQRHFQQRTPDTVGTARQARIDKRDRAPKATPSFKRVYTWGITKSVDKTLVRQIGGSAVFTYTVNVTHDGGTDSGWAVTGKITINAQRDADKSAVILKVEGGKFKYIETIAPTP